VLYDAFDHSSLSVAQSTLTVEILKTHDKNQGLSPFEEAFAEDVTE
jgi:hypothetical protein